MIENFLEIIYEICQNGIKKKSIGRSKIPKELRQMLGRLKRLKRKARKHNNEEKRKEIIELELEIQKTIEDIQEKNEEKSIENIVKNPKYLFAIINQQNKKNRTNEIGPLKIGEETIDKGKDIANKLIEEYINEFTEKEIKRKENGEIINERK